MNIFGCLYDNMNISKFQLFLLPHRFRENLRQNIKGTSRSVFRFRTFEVLNSKLPTKFNVIFIRFRCWRLGSFWFDQLVWWLVNKWKKRFGNKNSLTVKALISYNRIMSRSSIWNEKVHIKRFWWWFDAFH